MRSRGSYRCDRRWHTCSSSQRWLCGAYGRGIDAIRIVLTVAAGACRACAARARMKLAACKRLGIELHCLRQTQRARTALLQLFIVSASVIDRIDRSDQLLGNGRPRGCTQLHTCSLALHHSTTPLAASLITHRCAVSSQHCCSSASSTRALAPPRLRLLTCDLDDTFWPTAEVVAAANAALYRAGGERR